MKRIFAALAITLCATIAGAQTETFLQLPTDAANTGKKLRMRSNTISSNLVYSQGFFLEDGSGGSALGISSNPIFVNFITGANAIALAAGAATIGAISNTGFNVNNSPTVAQGTAAADTASWPHKYGVVAAVTAAWTSATALDTVASIATTDYATVTVSLRATSTMTGGTLNFEASDDGGTNWYAISALRVDVSASPPTETTFALSVTSRMWQVPVSGMTNFRVRLNPVITGTGTANIRIQASAAPTVAPAAVLAANQTVAQATGTNLHAVTDTGSTTAVTQATAGNLNATVVGSGNFTVTQATGTNLHAVLDTTSTTAVTQATAANLNATVAEGAASTAAASWFMRLTDGTDTALVDTTGEVLTDQMRLGGTAISVNNGVADAGTQRVVLAQELTYSAGTTLKTATAAGTGVFFALCGSATKTIAVQRLTISGTVATAAVYGDVIVRRTSTATSAGTATTLTPAPYDSNDAAATATAKYYTVLGTAGTLAMVIESTTQFFPITGTPALTPPPLQFRWRDQDSKSPVLRGTAQCLEAAFGTTTTNAPTLQVAVTWTEK